MIKLNFWLNKLSQAKKKEALTDNPYLNAKRSWNVHTAGLMKSLQVWQLVGLGSLLITLAAVGGLISIGSQSKFIPLVFQQDANSNTLSVTRADRVGQPSIDDYRAAAAHFIENIRMVSADVELQKKAVFQVYSYLKPQFWITGHKLLWILSTLMPGLFGRQVYATNAPTVFTKKLI
ncbi:VirB8/TrbF family protein, partial [Legionella pneumophila serogroup 1]